MKKDIYAQVYTTQHWRRHSFSLPVVPACYLFINVYYHRIKRMFYNTNNKVHHFTTQKHDTTVTDVTGKQTYETVSTTFADASFTFLTMLAAPSFSWLKSPNEDWNPDEGWCDDDCASRSSMYRCKAAAFWDGPKPTYNTIASCTKNYQVLTNCKHANCNKESISYKQAQRYSDRQMCNELINSWMGAEIKILKSWQTDNFCRCIWCTAKHVW